VLRQHLATSYKIVEELIQDLGFEYLPNSAGLWATVKIPNKDGDVMKLLAEKGVKIGTAPDINKFPGEKDWV
jgi:hypothetical protein